MRSRFDEQILEHEGVLYHQARYLTKSESDAGDLVQETFTRALKHRDRFQEGTNLRAWLGRILRNLFIDGLRRSRSEQVSLDEIALEPPGRDGPDREDTLDLEAALRSLSTRDRELIVLCDLEGRTYKEISEITGRPLGTIMSGMHRARAKLRARLGGASEILD